MVLVGCTPLGLWLYQDPDVSVARVRLDTDSTSRRPVLVALDLHNPNDFVVAATRVELRLMLDDVPIGRADEDSDVPMPKGRATVALPIVPGRQATPARLQAFASGTHRFTVEGRATFTTPIGKRKVRFAQMGEMTFGQPPSSASAPSGQGASP